MYCFNPFLNYITIFQGWKILCFELPDFYIMVYGFLHFKLILKESCLKIICCLHLERNIIFCLPTDWMDRLSTIFYCSSITTFQEWKYLFLEAKFFFPGNQARKNIDRRMSASALYGHCKTQHSRGTGISTEVNNQRWEWIKTGVLWKQQCYCSI